MRKTLFHKVDLEDRVTRTMVSLTDHLQQLNLGGTSFKAVADNAKSHAPRESVYGNGTPTRQRSSTALCRWDPFSTGTSTPSPSFSSATTSPPTQGDTPLCPPTRSPLSPCKGPKPKPLYPSAAQSLVAAADIPISLPLRQDSWGEQGTTITNNNTDANSQEIMAPTSLSDILNSGFMDWCDHMDMDVTDDQEAERPVIPVCLLLE